MRIFVTGHSGKVGSRLLKMGCLPLECDVTDLSSVNSAIEKGRPDVICHLAAMTNVDECELPANKEKVIKVNLRGAFNVALAAQEHKCGVILVSSDHVFDGKHGPYKETDHPNKPVNFYGMSKMAAEALQVEFKGMKIVRTSTLFSWERLFHLILDPVDFHKGYEFPTFLHRSFMYQGHFAACLYEYLLQFDIMPSILNISGSDTVSWYEFALATASIFGADKSHILPRKKELKEKEKAPRPHKAGLNTKLSSKLLKQYSYLDGLKKVKLEQE